MGRKEYTMDRGLRVLGGVILIGAVFFYGGEYLSFTARIIALFVGIYSFVSGIINYCPLSNLIISEKRFRRRIEIATDIKVNSVKNLAFFNGFNEKEIGKILPYCKDVAYAKDESIITEGKEKGTLNIIYSGEVKVLKDITGGSAKTIAVLEDGDVFGEVSFFDNLPPSASIVAMTNTRILEISDLDFSKIIEEDKDLAIKMTMKILQICSTRIRSLNEQIVSMGKWWLNNRKWFHLE
ncbi:MAG: cyclic nucleotide-binding domain-containing protein [Thermodesulfobacteriota bacterium]